MAAVEPSFDGGSSRSVVHHSGVLERPKLWEVVPLGRETVYSDLPRAVTLWPGSTGRAADSRPIQINELKYALPSASVGLLVGYGDPVHGRKGWRFTRSPELYIDPFGTAEHQIGEQRNVCAYCDRNQPCNSPWAACFFQFI